MEGGAESDERKGNDSHEGDCAAIPRLLSGHVLRGVRDHGSERAAERALVSAMIDGRGDDLERVKRHALAELEEGRGESFFACLSGEIDETDKLYDWLVLEADDTRRAVCSAMGWA